MIYSIISLVFISFLLSFTKSSFAQQQKIDSLLSVLQETKADTSRVMLFNEISIEYLFIKQDKAIEYANLGLALSQKNEYKKGLSICLNSLGRVYLNIGKLDSAMVCFEKRFKIVSELKDSIGIAIVNLNMGIIFYRYQDYNSALEIYKRRTKFLLQKTKKIYLPMDILILEIYTWIKQNTLSRWNIT